MRRTRTETTARKMRKNKPKPNSNGEMSVTDHLRELRNRIIVTVLLLIVAFLVAMYFAPELVSKLLEIGKAYDYEFIYISPQELLLQYFSIAMVASLVVTMPMIFYQVWAYVKPGLKEKENSFFLFSMIFGLICFAVGVLFAYKIMLPFMMRFLIELSDGTGISASISVQNYITFLLTIFIILGIVFELPVVSVLLTQMGLLRASWMKKGRKLVIVCIFIIAAFITPPDVVSQIMVAIPMLGLYELSIILCSFFEKLRKKKEE